MKDKFASWKFRAWKFRPGRFAGLGVSFYASHWHKIEGPSKKPIPLAGPRTKITQLDNCR